MIRIRDLVFAAGGFRLEVSLEIARGEYFVLMGPPGSGKSMLVECLAGLRVPSAGSVEIGGEDVTGLEPRLHSVGYVPQDYALFANRTVRGNIAFGPEVHGWPRAETDEAVRRAAELLGIAGLLDRRVQNLSGGEKQRTALARAVVLRPLVLILDEPVSALDEATRESVCGELRRLQRELGIATIHISHNLEEAFSVADRGAVMQNGRVRQVGTMEELLRRPASEFVARFMRCGNVFAGVCRGPGSTADTTVAAAGGAEFLLPGARQGRVRFVVRPENLHLSRPDGPGPARDCPGPASDFRLRLVRAVDRGAYVRAELGGPVELVAHLPHRAFAELGAAEGAELAVRICAAAVHVLPPEPGDEEGGPVDGPAPS